MTKRQLIISIILTIIILLIGTLGYQKLSSSKSSTISKDKPIIELRPVETQVFTVENMAKKIDVDGRIQAYEKINLSAEVSGRLIPTSKKLKPGSYFSKGDILFKINDKELNLNIKAQRANLQSTITQMMPDIKFDYPSEFQKWKSYLDEFDVEKHIRELPSASTDQEKYFVSGRNIYNQYYNIKSQEERLNFYQIHAPFNGVFLSLNVYPGSVVSPGMSLGQLMNTYNIELIATVALEDFKYVKIGQKVDLASQELDKSWSGTISRIGKQIDQNTQSIPIYISMSGNGLRDGMYLKGHIKGNELNDIVAIPKTALVDVDQVFIVQDSIISKKKIEVVSQDAAHVYTKEISANDHVIVDGVKTLYAGQKVIENLN